MLLSRSCHVIHYTFQLKENNNEVVCQRMWLYDVHINQTCTFEDLDIDVSDAIMTEAHCIQSPVLGAIPAFRCVFKR